jgi:cytochrome P450
MEDDVHAGYLIPEGSLIIPNIWHMLHDPTVYVDPMDFKPERFIGSPIHTAEPDPKEIAFGFGRR